MSRRAPTARLFVAVNPPEEVCDQLASWARAAAREAQGRSRASSRAREHARDGSSPERPRAISPLRVLDPGLLHVTLHFLGDCALEQIELLAQRLSACACPVGELSVGAPLWLPPRCPRCLAVELHDPDGGLTRMHAQAIATLEQAGSWRARPTPRTRRGESGGRRGHFRPHITVARMGHSYMPRERLLPPTPSLSFIPEELVLYRSWLAPEGASYEALATHPIG